MGSYVLKTTGTVYQAATDGFVAGYIVADHDGERGYLSGWTSAYEGGYVLRMRVNVHLWGFTDAQNQHNSFLMPVKQGDYWYTSKTNTVGSCVALTYWVSLG